MLKKQNFYCNDCQCGFHKIQHYHSHLNTKKHENRISKDKTKLHICLICKKNFAYSSGLSRHRMKCKEVKDIPPKINILEKEIIELRKQIEDLQQSKNTTNHINTQNNNNTTQNNNIKKQNQNITINYFGNENLDYITDKIVLKCIDKIYGSIPMLIEKIHFDPEHPENHNIQIPNKKLPHAKVMTNKNKWIMMKKEDAIDSMIDNGYNILDEKFQEKGCELSDKQQHRFKDFQNKYEDGDKDTMRNIKDKVELIVINKTRG